MNDVELAIRMTADATDAAKAMDSVGGAATDMAREVDNAADKADDATRKLGGVADVADTVDTKMGGATASLGALSGGLEAAGFDKAAGALGTLGQATDFAAGAGQGLALVLELEAVQTARAKVAAVGKAVADKAMAAGSKAAAAGQWLLNAALTANPIGLVVAGVAALIAGLVLAYKKSETFREIVDGAMSGVKKAVQVVVDIVGDVKDKVADVIDGAGGLSGPFEIASTLIKGYIELMLLPLKLVKDAIEWIIDHLKDIKLPDLPDIPGFGRTAAAGAAGVLGDRPFSHDPVGRGGDVHVHLPGAVVVGNDAAVGQYISRVVAAELRRLGPS